MQIIIIACVAQPLSRNTDSRILFYIFFARVPCPPPERALYINQKSEVFRMKKRIYVFTGGRDFTDRRQVNSFLSLYISPEDVVMVGDCPTGLDAMIRDAIPSAQVFAADWRRFGRRAGPYRNCKMCQSAAALASATSADAYCVAFPGGRGTASCVLQARRAGLRLCELPELRSR